MMLCKIFVFLGVLLVVLEKVGVIRIYCDLFVGIIVVGY